MIGITLLAEVCGALGDGDVPGPVRRARAVRGPQRRRRPGGDLQRRRRAPLRILAGAMRQWELARAFITARDARADGRAAVGGADLAYAEMLSRAASAATKRARELLADAVVIADALGMGVIAQRARDLVPAGAGWRRGRQRHLTKHATSRSADHSPRVQRGDPVGEPGQRGLRAGRPGVASSGR
jgi:hypothetical protein